MMSLATRRAKLCAYWPKPALLPRNMDAVYLSAKSSA